jgi:hypothetical protein
MAKHKQVLAVTEAARDAARQLATWDTLQEMGRKAMDAAEKKAQSANFAEFMFSSAKAVAIVRVGDAMFRFEA